MSFTSARQHPHISHARLHCCLVLLHPYLKLLYTYPGKLRSGHYTSTPYVPRTPAALSRAAAPALQALSWTRAPPAPAWPAASPRLPAAPHCAAAPPPGSCPQPPAGAEAPMQAPKVSAPCHCQSTLKALNRRGTFLRQRLVGSHHKPHGSAPPILQQEPKHWTSHACNACLQRSMISSHTQCVSHNNIHQLPLTCLSSFRAWTLASISRCTLAASRSALSCLATCWGAGFRVQV